ncbi:hypothetical protein NECAME_05766 [Necator americanus]|uniref:Uncharacterized protein n=1 Tax=Necator americanus TaxID=51031 RepID=W2TXX9_NECAM|nr:hypothetical protein NECAME_05766 [Necator americanus]ETN86920.1 hypothetical protein NECAME_05766 [Necator americanus]
MTRCISIKTVTIFWIMIWVYASIMAITTGYLWSLEWLGGPQSDRAAISHDIMNDRYPSSSALSS